MIDVNTSLLSTLLCVRYEPLPADQFSPTLRQLVTGMLHVDPVARPELEEVWTTTSAVIQAQARGQQDVYAAAELVHGRCVCVCGGWVCGWGIKGDVFVWVWVWVWVWV